MTFNKFIYPLKIKSPKEDIQRRIGAQISDLLSNRPECAFTKKQTILPRLLAHSELAEFSRKTILNEITRYTYLE